MKKLQLLTVGAMFLSASLAYGQDALLQKQKHATTADQTVLETFRPQKSPVAFDEREREELIRHASASDAPEISSISSLKPEGKTGPVQPPYRCSFDDEAVFISDWDSINGSVCSYSYWKYNAGGYAVSAYCYSGNVVNFLITKNPIQMTAGDAYVTFKHKADGTKYRERLKVFYGKTKDTAQANLTLIGEIMDSSADWKFDILPFTLAEAGDYYFFFLCCSDANQYNFSLDDIEINTGVFQGTPNLVVDRVILPLSSCALGTAESIGVQLSNEGSATISKMKLSYTLDGGTMVEETTHDSIKIGPFNSTIVYFNGKADLSEVGSHEVSVKAEIVTSDGKAEENLEDNSGKNSVENFQPLEALPFDADLSHTDDLKKLGYDPVLWAYDTESKSLNALATEPLVTQCFPLDADEKYRLTFDYLCGRDMFWFPVTEDYDILCGQAGTPMETWTTLASVKQDFTNDEFITANLTFENKTAGNYSVAFVPKNPEGQKYTGTLYIAKIHLEKLQPHDIKVETVLADIAALTPAQHAIKPNIDVLVANRGLLDEQKVTVTLLHKDKVVGVSDSVSLKRDSLTVLSAQGELPLPDVDDRVTITIMASMQDYDANPTDNQAEWRFTATKDFYAFDDTTIVEYEDGIGSSSNSVGNIFTLLEQDTLTAVALGLFDVTEYVDGPYDVRLEIYPVNEDGTAGTRLLTYDFERQLAGTQTVQIPARILPAGRYLVALKQLTVNVALGYDMNPNGYFYATKGEGTNISIMTTRGFLAVRAIFGENGKVVEQDIEMLEIQQPRDNGSFTANEKVIGTYVNNGCLETEVKFQCLVDGKAAGNTQSVKVPAYEHGTIEFTVDLSAIGSHTVAIEAKVDTDETPANNKVEKTVTCHVFDPYVMNFEVCDDFAIDNLTPWKTVDVDDTETYGIEGCYWPNATEKMGFMAFNPALTSPALTSLMNTHGGSRMGATFASVEVPNNDWLISPKLRMPAEGAQLSFYTMTFNAEEYSEKYNVLVSENSDDPADFKQLGDTYTAPEAWGETVVDLSAYNGKEIYIAIQCVSNDQFMLLIDDITVSKPVPNEHTTDLSQYVKSYPNPVTDVWTVTAYGLEISRVEIFNLTGGVVFRSADHLDTETYRVNMGGFTPGLYTARVQTNVGVQTLKIIVR